MLHVVELEAKTCNLHLIYAIDSSASIGELRYLYFKRVR